MEDLFAIHEERAGKSLLVPDGLADLLAARVDTVSEHWAEAENGSWVEGPALKPLLYGHPLSEEPGRTLVRHRRITKKLRIAYKEMLLRAAESGNRRKRLRIRKRLPTSEINVPVNDV
jgi:hypothetical protein